MLRNNLLATSALCCFAGIAQAQTCSAPAIAAAAGYTTQTANGVVLGQSVFPFAYDGVNPAATGVSQNADGSVSIPGGGGDSWNGQLATATPSGQGASFGGGGYYQATITWMGAPSTSGGWPSFWANTNEGGSGTNVELDVFEADTNWAGSSIGSGLHNWNADGSQTGTVGNAPQRLPAGFDPSQPHTYGVLVVPATATSLGSVTYYVDGVAGPNVNTFGLTGPYSDLNTKPLTFLFGTGPNNPMKVLNFQAWQNPTTAKDTGVSVGSAAAGCATTSPTLSGATVAAPVVSAPVMAVAAPVAADASGNTWTVNSAGCIQENGRDVPGGCQSKDVKVVDGVVWGLDNGSGPVCPGCWFQLSGAGGWTPEPGQSPSVGAAVAAAPVIAVPQCTSTTEGDGRFHVQGGQIIGPDGKVWLARGINVYDNEAAGAASAMTQVFTGLNFVRVGIHSYQDPSAYQGFVSDMTGTGRVVEFENHPDGGGGQDSGPPGGIAAESAWYASMAKAYAGNPYVWFGTFNEPMATSQLSSWQKATYDAIRGTGNNNPILLEISGYPGNWTNSLNPSTYATMTNVIWDPHFYGWIPRYSADQGTVDQALTDEIAGIQQIHSADGVVPVLVGEYGDSTDGTHVDANSVQVVSAVVNAGSTGKFGSAAWAWNPGGNADHLLAGGMAPSDPYGQIVQLYINTDVTPLSACQIQAASATAINAATVAVAQVGPATTPEQATATPAATASSAVDQSVADAQTAAAQDAAQKAADAAAVDAPIQQAIAAAKARSGQ